MAAGFFATPFDTFRTGLAWALFCAVPAMAADTLPLTAAQKNNLMFSSLQRSDHAAFWAKNIPAIMLTDTAEYRNIHYHCMSGMDTPDTLTPEFAEKVVRAAVSGAASLLQVQAVSR